MTGNKLTRTLFTLLFAPLCMAAAAQTRTSLLDSLHYKVELQASLSAGSRTPLWMNANKYGLSSLNRTNGYLRGGVARPLSADKGRRWGIGYGVDVAVAARYSSRFIVQQAYAEVRWLKGVLTVGAKEYPMELKNSELSTGPQTLGINARPVPQVRLALPDYWTIPFTKGWLALKGHIAYGKTTDDKWQKEFSRQQSKYTERTLYHSKAGYLRIGKETHPFNAELGLEMAAQFGGTSYIDDLAGGLTKVENEGGLKGMWHAFIPGGGESVEDTYKNASGNILGSWVIRLNYDNARWGASLYYDHFFEDHSAMFQLDYDGYGTGDEWNTRKRSRYVLYDFKDMLLGAEVRLKNTPWLNTIVFEYMYTKYQSGPVYHDRTPSMSDHIGGRDSYYHHYIFTGWQHWGMVMGNPLFMSPLYNTATGEIDVKNNRFYAFHLGVKGRPMAELGYRLLATWQKGFGTYNEPYPHPRETWSLLLEGDYRFAERSRLRGWSVRAGIGIDHGRLYGNNGGLQLTIAKTGLLTK